MFKDELARLEALAGRLKDKAKDTVVPLESRAQDKAKLKWQTLTPQG